ncbi:hypothetical protein H0H81_010844 [Sphagnurus paluster]|uniref:Uncharacterized protein n=1 Tax=Sphagnurus paluster TaxID=117069 RepID=A0A9P7GVP5_9AGAR|nr:hypothetical protein H0H81_010844 [Sphagnurus paluster]
MDYVGPEVEPEEVKEAVRRRRQTFIYALPNALSQLTRKRFRVAARDDTENANVEEKAICEHGGRNGNPSINRNSRSGSVVGFSSATAMPVPLVKHVSFHEDATTAVPTDGVRSPICSPTPTEIGIGSPSPTLARGDAPKSILQVQEKQGLPTTSGDLPSEGNGAESPAASTVSYLGRVTQILRAFLASLSSPASLGILLSFPIALIPPLKGLFVDLPPSTSTSKFANPHILSAPDGHPPLAVLFDTASFIGAASVPLGLICLGAALARLNVPRNQWRSLPTGAIGMLAIGKILVAPMFGVGIVRGLVAGGLIAKEDKVLQFVCM